MATVDSFESRVAEIVETTLREHFYSLSCDYKCNCGFGPVGHTNWGEHIATIVAAKVVEEATKTVEDQRDYWDKYVSPDGMKRSVHAALSLVIESLGGKRS